MGSSCCEGQSFYSALLYPHKSDDINMRSTWLCSRNDIVANVSVLVASAMVVWTKTLWPDTLVAHGIAGLFLKSAFQVIVEAKQELKAHV